MPCENYYKTKLKKMGVYNLYPLDLDNWHGPESARYFKRLFGFGKGTLNINVFDGNGAWENAYFPQWFFDKLFKYIADGTAKDYKFLERKLLKFYDLRKRLKKNLLKITAMAAKKLSNAQLIKIYEANRDWVHRATVFDQFGWIAESYWNEPTRAILLRKGLEQNSPEYHRVLFALTKPAEMSTTLLEKMAVLDAIFKIKRGKLDVKKAARSLARQYGWMSVSAYGEPWDALHYENEIATFSQVSEEGVRHKLRKLKKYSLIRRNWINAIIKKYNFTKQELQVFIDLGLVVDTRNEAEYLVSYCGFYVLPLYKEICRRLFLSVNQLRTLYEHEVVEALRGKLNMEEVLAARRRYCGYGYDKKMLKRYYFSEQQAKKLFAHLEKNVEYIGVAGGDKGICASPGKEKGVVKIVIGPQDNHKVKFGDIMISIATMVDHLPAMKNATKIFKDGDLVEVDADNGVVRKI